MDNDKQMMIVDSVTHSFRMACAEIVQEHTSYHATLRPRLFIDGNQWCALYGENLQDGVAGFGDTPSKALRDFNSAMYRSLNTQGEG